MFSCQVEEMIHIFIRINNMEKMRSNYNSQQHELYLSTWYFRQFRACNLLKYSFSMIFRSEYVNNSRLSGV